MIKHTNSGAKVKETKRVGADCRIRKLVSPPHDAKPHRFPFRRDLSGFQMRRRINNS